jgi:hypothetical protein
MIFRQQLQQQQLQGECPVEFSLLLDSKYSNRYQQAAELFSKLSSDVFVELNTIPREHEPEMYSWTDATLPEKMSGIKHEGAVFGYDVDTMIGPHDWFKSHDQPAVGDYVQRKKCYIYGWTGQKLPADFPELQYFVDMHADFLPVLRHYRDECYPDQSKLIKKYIYKLMVIEYSTPTATTPESQIQHRKFNTERFGDSHCDETLGGLHLGENYAEFQVQNILTGHWDFVPGLDQSNMLWMFGEHSASSGWTPTYHRMVHNSETSRGTRYSIIFDLQARYA